MPALASDLRKTLETTVVKARELAERGARDALTALAVGASEPFASMSEEERKLRNRLRAHGRQLGDQRDPQKGSQSIERLVREMAYEHWHRMLFARFLAENQLLIEPSSGVAISLDECEELAAEEGSDLWGLAAQFAQSMLPQIFRVDDPVLEARLPLEIRQQLQGLVAELETETFTASDSLGWTYQFWQTKRKKEVNDSGVKIGADELSPVTQLFTEDYMVDFLLDNTLGAWHAGKVLAANPALASTAKTEDDLRQAVALPDCPWSYLRFVKSDDGAWAPAAGTFEGWPRTAAELKCLDPCMGSGHFVVAMLERLMALRIKEEGLSGKTAVAAVIEGNLFGLEVDPRCTQIGAFNLALAGWRRVAHCKLPAMNIACSGLSPNRREEDWLEIAGDNQKLRNGMERLHRLFQKADVLGSLISPRAVEANLLVAEFDELQPLLELAFAQKGKDENTDEIAVTARGLAKAAEILADTFHLVITNVPYLARGKQCQLLRDYCKEHYPDSKTDLATCFIERCLAFCKASGASALVTPQSWLLLSGFKKLRASMLKKYSWKIAAKLGTGAFETIGGEIVNVSLFVFGGGKPSVNHLLSGFDTSQERTPPQKSIALCTAEPKLISQVDQINNPGTAVTFSANGASSLLLEHADCWQGLVTADDNRFVLRWWELQCRTSDWEWLQLQPQNSGFSEGRLAIVRWEGGTGELHLKSGAHNFPSKQMLGRPGLAIQRMKERNVTLFDGAIFGDHVAPIIPRDPGILPALWCYCTSQEYKDEVRKLDSTLKAAVGSFIKTPFDLEYWQRVARDRYPHGLPRPSTCDPAQWLFTGHPVDSDNQLQVGVARLVGFQWPRQTGSSFPDCLALDPDGLEALADEDGIVCLTPIRGEASAADRLRGLLAAALGDEWNNAKERELLLETAVSNDAKKAPADLADWLRQNFFVEHCKLFQSRPFIWQIWDGNPHGFSALVNYHKLAAPMGQGRKTLEQLTYTYLGDWIDRQQLDQAEGVSGADDRLASAFDLQDQLKKILEGESPYDIFVRWKPLNQQPIGWEPDINDGVRLNIRPFLSAQLRKGGKAGAGILRAKPGTIKWAKDKGKEPMRSMEDFPWCWGWDDSNRALEKDFGAPIPGAPPAGDSFDGNRWNDLHYTRAAKVAARARHRGEG